MPGTSASWVQTPPHFSRARLPWTIAFFWPSRTSSADLAQPQKLFSVEPHFNIRSLLQMHRIDEPHLPLIQRQNHGTGAHAFPEKPHTLQQVSVRHARARENHFLSRSQIFRVVNALQILHAHFCKAFRVLRFADEDRKSTRLNSSH